MKNIFKRIVTVGLSGLLLLTTAINSYAETNNQYVNGGGSGSQNSGGDFQYSGSYHIYHVNAGIRFYAMNQEGTVVTNTVDMVQYFPQDFAAGAAFSAEKFAYMTSTYQNKIGFWDKNKNSDLNSDNVAGGKYSLLYLGGGKTDANYLKSYDNLMNPTRGLSCIKRGSYDKSNPAFNNITAGQAKVYLYSDIETYLKGYITTNYPGEESPIDPAGGTYTYPDAETGETRTISKKFKNPFHFENWDVGLLASGEHMKHQLMATLGNNKEYVLQMLLRMEAPVTDGTGKLVGGAKPLLEFYDTRLNQKLEQLKSSGSQDAILDLIQQEQLYLGVEPVFWSVFEVYWPSNNVTSANGANQQAFYSTPYILYGTPSHIYWEAAKEFADFVNINSSVFKMTAPDPLNDLENFKGFLESHGFFGHWQWGQGESCYMLEKDEPELGLTTYSKMWTMDPKFWRTMIEGYYTIGYGIMTFKLAPGNPGMSTWDNKTYPPTNYKPGPAPQVTDPNQPDGPYPVGYPSEGSEYRPPNPNKDHKFNIVKFYAEKNPDGSYIYKENHTREQAIHTITIDNEPGYTVDNYYTSSTFTKPTNPTDDYDVWKTNRAPKNTYEGTKSEKLVVKATDPDTTLYIRLVSTPTLTIVKYFPDGSNKIEEIPWVPTYDTVEPGYEYEKDKQDPNKPDTIPDDFESTTGTPGSNPIIPVDSTSRIVYIKYKQPEADSKITLHQNELAHTFTLEDIQSLVTLTHNFPNMYYEGSNKHGSGSDAWWCDWNTVMSDAKYAYSISNKENYGATTFVGSQGAFKSEEIGKNDDQGSMGINGGQTGGLRPNLKFSIYRDRAKDNVTLYPNKNSNVKGELSQIYITAEGYTPQTQRVLDKGQTEWYSTFKINYTYDTEDNTVSYKSSLSCHGPSGSEDGSPHPALGTINDPFSQANNVLTKAFLGQPGKGEKVSGATAEAFTLSINGRTFNFNRNLKYKFTSQENLLKGFNNHKKDYDSNQARFFKFYPYTEMEYQTVTDLSNKLAYIVSTNLSEVKDNTSVEVGVYQSGVGDTILLSSEQWSTHARTIQGLRDNGIKQQLLNKSLIPGGAVVKLSTAGADAGTTPEVWVGFRSYEMSISDDLKVTLSEDTGVKTTSQAKEDAKIFFNDMKNNLSNYHLEKWIMEGISTNESDIKSKAKKVSGINTGGSAGSQVVTSFGGNQLSTDPKYYLKSNASDATSSKFDAWNEEFEQHVYRVYSDVYGKVTVTKDGSEIASSNIKADKNLSGLLANPDVKRIDDRVKFVTNFIQSLDFEGGKDREAIPWYYEAHDGIEVVESMGFMQVGFDPRDKAIRSEVADPKLTGKLENRDDTLNFNSATLNQKTRTVQYKMSSSPTTNPGEPGYVGEFNGEPIVIPQISEILKTRLHYMGNNTVMDLN